MTTINKRTYENVKLEASHISSPLSHTDSTHSTMSPIKESPNASPVNSPKANRRSKRTFTFNQEQVQKQTKRNQKTTNGLANCSSKLGNSKLVELLEEYREKSSTYRDEEFTQTSCSFLSKIAAEESIPSEIRSNCSFYYILVSISKIFMMNEYELALLACTFDHCNWNIEEIVKKSEEHYLNEFPCSLEVEITKESRALIMYLLIIGFSLKSNIIEQSELELIEAYCQKICTNFSELVKRAQKNPAFPKTAFTQMESNKKFKALSKKDHQEPFMKTIKDYNMVVEGILRLTGSHTAKPKAKFPPVNAKNLKKSVVSEDHTAESDQDPDMFYNDFNNQKIEEVDTAQAIFSKQNSYETESYMDIKREASVELFEEEEVNKRMKFDEDVFMFLQQNEQPIFPNKKVNMIFEDNNEDFFNADLPIFGRFNSNLSGIFSSK